jgi:hypothetical protein
MARTDAVVAPDLTGIQFDLASIDLKLLNAQKHEALGGEEGVDDLALFRQDFDLDSYQQVFRKQAKLGVPGIRDVDRQQKIESILDDMVEAGILRFHPPDMWSVL